MVACDFVSFDCEWKAVCQSILARHAAGLAPRRILLVHGKAEASFAHSKSFAQYDSAVHVGASRCEGATEPRGSVWSARSLLPLWLVPRQHALWNRQDCKGEKLFLFQVQCQWAGRGLISARSKIEMLPSL